MLCFALFASGQQILKGNEGNITTSCDVDVVAGQAVTEDFLDRDEFVNSVSIVNCTDGVVTVDIKLSSGKTGQQCIPPCNTLNMDLASSRFDEVTATSTGAGMILINGLRDNRDAKLSYGIGEIDTEIVAANCPGKAQEAVVIESSCESPVYTFNCGPLYPDTFVVTKNYCLDNFILCDIVQIVSGVETVLSTSNTGMICPVSSFVDVECNEVTNTWFYFTTENGETTEINSGVPCRIPKDSVDYEIKYLCDDGTQIAQYIGFVNGTGTVLMEMPTGQICNEFFNTLSVCVEEPVEIGYFLNGGECLFSEAKPPYAIGDIVCWEFDDFQATNATLHIQPGQGYAVNGNEICWNYDGTDSFPFGKVKIDVVSLNCHLIETIESDLCLGGGGDEFINANIPTCIDACIGPDKIIRDLEGNELETCDPSVICEGKYTPAPATFLEVIMDTLQGIQTVTISGADTLFNTEILECAKWSSVVLFWDNTKTRFNRSYEVLVTNADGSTTNLNYGPYAGWTQQVQGMADVLQAAYPSAVVDVRCNFLPNGCGGLLAPPSDAIPSGNIFARYVSAVFCPTDINIPVKFEIVAVNGVDRKPFPMVLEIIETEEKRGWYCKEKGTTGELLDEDCEPVPAADLPACWFTCAELIPEAPLATCETELIPVCDDLNTDATIFALFEDCGDGEILIGYYELVDGALEDYVSQGEIIGEGCVPCEIAQIETLCASDCEKIDVYYYSNCPTTYFLSGTDIPYEPKGTFSECETKIISKEKYCAESFAYTWDNGYAGYPYQGSPGKYNTPWGEVLLFNGNPLPNGGFIDKRLACGSATIDLINFGGQTLTGPFVETTTSGTWIGLNNLLWNTITANTPYTLPAGRGCDQPPVNGVKSTNCYGKSVSCDDAEGGYFDVTDCFGATWRFSIVKTSLGLQEFTLLESLDCNGDLVCNYYDENKQPVLELDEQCLVSCDSDCYEPCFYCVQDTTQFQCLTFDGQKISEILVNGVSIPLSSNSFTAVNDIVTYLNSQGCTASATNDIDDTPGGSLKRDGLRLITECPFEFEIEIVKPKGSVIWGSTCIENGCVENVQIKGIVDVNIVGECESTSVYDAVCSAGEEITVYVRQIKEDCKGNIQVVYYDFDDPTKVVVPVGEVEPCEPSTTISKTLCGSDGKEYIQVTVIVGTDTGDIVQIVFYDEGGNIVKPPNELFPCDAPYQSFCGCDENGADVYQEWFYDKGKRTIIYVNSSGSVVKPIGWTKDCSPTISCPDPNGTGGADCEDCNERGGPQVTSTTGYAITDCTDLNDPLAGTPAFFNGGGYTPNAASQAFLFYPALQPSDIVGNEIEVCWDAMTGSGIGLSAWIDNTQLPISDYGNSSHAVISFGGCGTPLSTQDIATGNTEASAGTADWSGAVGTSCVKYQLPNGFDPCTQTFVILSHAYNRDDYMENLVVNSIPFGQVSCPEIDVPLVANPKADAKLDSIISILSTAKVADVNWDYCIGGEKVKIVTFSDNITTIYNLEGQETTGNIECCDCGSGGLPDPACIINNTAEANEQFKIIICGIDFVLGDAITIYNADGSVACNGTITFVNGAGNVLQTTCPVQAGQLIAK